jgi:hypothetical protein
VSLTTGGLPADNQVSSRVLTKVECRTLVSSQHERRLGYQTGPGPRAVAVSYPVTDEQVVARLPVRLRPVIQRGTQHAARPLRPSPGRCG